MSAQEIKPIDGSIDAGLHVLSLVTPRGVELTHEEIAYVCGCSRGLIWSYEKRAMQKIRRILKNRSDIRELLHEIG